MFSKKDLLLIAALVLVSITIKLYAISGNDIVFIYDQARDANISRQIIENRDFKIMGPSASGSDEKLYHGVLYYYIIGPLYTLFQGSPFPVAAILGVINSLSIVMVFFLAHSLTGNKVAAYSAALLMAFSFESAQLSTWLSNPGLVLLTAAMYYYFLWKTFFDNKPHNFILLMASLGLSNQFFLYTLHLWLPVILGALWAIYMQRKINISLKTILLGIGAYLLSISTMIATQLLQYVRGINPIEAGDIVGGKSLFKDLEGFIQNTTSLYSKQITASTFFEYELLSILFIAICLLVLFFNGSKNQRAFIAICLASPLLMLAIQPRNATHTLVGISVVIYLLIAAALSTIKNLRLQKIVLISVIIVFSSVNIYSLIQAKNRDYHIFSVQQGSMLKYNLQAIDYTYQAASGDPFSISTLTNPYLYNTTWAYLYDWYGQGKYGYKPSFRGSSQQGIFAGIY
jgi:4-amino-4-deoxy-L-arabinose transferase-like glycosyltransferase